MMGADPSVEHAATRVLADARTLDDAAPRILEGICTALDWDVAVLWTVDRGTLLRCADVWRRDDPELERFERACRVREFTKGEGLPGRIWASGQPAWVADVVSDLNFPRAPAAEDAGLHGAFGFPIVVRGETFGVMEFFSRDVHEPDDDVLEMVRPIGIQIGQFIEREQLQARLALQNAILESQAEAALDGIIVVGSDTRILYSNARFADIWAIPPEVMEAGDDAEIYRRMILKLAEPDAFAELIGYLADQQDETGRDELELSDGRVLDRWTAPLRGPNQGRAWFYRDITEQKHIERRLRENERWMAFIAEATTVLSQTLDYEGELERLAALAVPILGDGCVIHVVEPDGDVRLVAIGHENEELLGEVRRQVPAGVPSVVRTGQSILYEEITDDMLAGSQLGLGFRSAMIVPLICRDRVLGTLMLVSSRRYTKEDMRLAEDLAARAAFPIDNARLYQERARVAQTLQESLLPPDLPEIPGVELAARYHAAVEVADVGGDFYDLFATGARNWGLVLGDVSGKGVEAAVVTSLARHTLRAAALTSRAPADLLSILNTALLEQTEPDRFVTAVCADIRPRFGRLVVNVACGGHPAPYVVRSDGSVEQIPSEGTLLGIVPDPQLTDVTLELGFGDKIVFYTDGVLEARSGERTFGRNEFENLLHETATRGVGAAADMIVKAVIDFQDGRPRDDIALVVIGVRASIFRRPRRVLHFVRDS